MREGDASDSELKRKEDPATARQEKSAKSQIESILIDVGNTAIKWQGRLNGEPVNGGAGTVDELLRWLRGLGDISQVEFGVSCVRNESVATDLEQALREKGCESVTFARSTRECRGIISAYDNPADLGVDRWLALLSLKSHGHDSGIVADVGTACTIDILEGGQHVGGFILPGPSLACHSLVANTDKIRFSKEPPVSLAPGTDTGACVVGGAWLSIASAIKEVTLQYPGLPLYLTGGAAPTLVELGLDGILASDLIFDGLDFWLNGA